MNPFYKCIDTIIEKHLVDLDKKGGVAIFSNPTLNEWQEIHGSAKTKFDATMIRGIYSPEKDEYIIWDNGFYHHAQVRNELGTTAGDFNLYFFPMAKILEVPDNNSDGKYIDIIKESGYFRQVLSKIYTHIGRL